MGLTIGITGASGFIGKNIAQRAAAAGHTVVGLDLAPGGEDFYRSLGGRFVQGDITSPASAREFSKGLDRVYHTAAIVKENGAWDLFRKVNVGGTVTMLNAAREAGVKEFVHFSSVMVYGFDFPDNVPEDGPLRDDNNPYCGTKIESEAEATKFHQPGVLDVYIIRPGDVYGPGSIPWTVRPVQMMKQGRWIFVNSRTSIHNHVYVDNLIDGIDVILSKKKSGTPFVISDDQRTTVRQFFSHYQRYLGIKTILEVPSAVAYPLALAAGRIASFFNADLGVNEQGVRYMCRTGKYSIEKVKALGYRPAVSLEEGMERCRVWLEGEGML